MKTLTHFDEEGQSCMVDVTQKAETVREAIASGCVYAQTETIQLIAEHRMAKGDVLEVARLAGIMAAKKTGELIPLCHPLALTSVELQLSIDHEHNKVNIEARIQTIGRTGVEMEALTAVAVAGLTVYDMCKAVDRGMIISDIKLLKKSGGKSGTFVRNPVNI